MKITKREKLQEELGKYTDREIVSCVMDLFLNNDLDKLLFELKSSYNKK